MNLSANWSSMPDRKRTTGRPILFSWLGRVTTGNHRPGRPPNLSSCRRCPRCACRVRRMPIRCGSIGRAATRFPRRHPIRGGGSSAGLNVLIVDRGSFGGGIDTLTTVSGDRSRADCRGPRRAGAGRIEFAIAFSGVASVIDAMQPELMVVTTVGSESLRMDAARVAAGQSSITSPSACN